MTPNPAPTVEQIAGRLTKAQRGMISRSRVQWNEPPRCFGPGVTKKALRERGLAHGDFAYLTILGEQVKAFLADQERQS